MSGSMGRNASVQRLSTCQRASGKDGKNAYTEKFRSEIVPDERISRYSEPQHDCTGMTRRKGKDQRPTISY
jgi:hypothetical protein